VLFFICSSVSSFSQNLIPNGDFETGTCCPNNSCDWIFPCSDAFGNSYAFWGAETSLFNGRSLSGCSSSITEFYRSVPSNKWGYQIPLSGIAYAGIKSIFKAPNFVSDDWRLFLFTRTLRPLTNGAKYDINVSVSLTDHSRLACNNLQVLFCDTSPVLTFNSSGGVGNLVSYTNWVSFTGVDSLNDKVNWMPLSCSYFARGTENYLSIGNYLPDSLSTYYAVPSDYPADTLGIFWDDADYYVDDVSITLGIDAGKDTSICGAFGSFLELKASAGWQHYQWSNGVAGRNTTITQPGVYVVTGTIDSLPGFTKSDTVVVSLSANSMALSQLKLPKDTTICKGEPIEIIASHSTPNMTYLWNNGSSANPLIVDDAGSYVLLTQLGACYKRDTIVVSTFPINQMLLDSSEIRMSNLNNLLTITANPGFTQYTWSTGDTTKQISFSASTIKVGWLGLSAYTLDGCLVHDSVFVNYQELPIIIPNPQQSGKGNVFTILNLPSNSQVYLYDNHGKQVLQSTNYSNNFALDFSASALYYYKIVMSNGEVINGKVVVE
jgi:hypothetical protein